MASACSKNRREMTKRIALIQPPGVRGTIVTWSCPATEIFLSYNSENLWIRFKPEAKPAWGKTIIMLMEAISLKLWSRSIAKSKIGRVLTIAPRIPKRSPTENWKIANWNRWVYLKWSKKPPQKECFRDRSLKRKQVTNTTACIMYSILVTMLNHISQECRQHSRKR